MSNRRKAGGSSTTAKRKFPKLTQRWLKRDETKALRHCDPIYLLPNRADALPGKGSESATVTYIQFRGKPYALTCAHVATARQGGQEDGEILIPIVVGLTGKRFAFSEGSLSPMAGVFRVPQRPSIDKKLDIAIAPLSDGFVEAHLKAKGKVPLDLDAWLAPDWSQIKTCTAWGFPKSEKVATYRSFGGKLFGITLEVATSISEMRDEFSLYYKLRSSAGRSLSGMSGSAIFCRYSDESLLAIGMLYEGKPGELSSAADPQAFFTKSDFQIQAHLLTPSRFEEWLRELGLLSGPSAEPPAPCSGQIDTPPRNPR